MKKLAYLLVATFMTLTLASPAFAGVTTEPDSSFVFPWSLYSPGNVSLDISGSLKEGASYTLTARGTCPLTSPDDSTYDQLSSRYNSQIIENASSAVLASALDHHSGDSVSIDFQTSATLTAGPAGTSRYFLASTRCTWLGASHPGFWKPGLYRTSLYKVTFEPAVGSVSNFSIFPQAAGTAFTTWAVADGATSYTVTATPGGGTCTTTQNFCVISGLTAGSTYDFSVVATNGTASSAAVSSGPVVLRQPVTVAVGLNGGTWRVGETVTAQYSVQGSSATPTITWYRCLSVVGAMPTPPAPAECSVVGSGSSYVLAAGDVGKYITAHVLVTNTDPQGQMTASNMNAVLASGAAAPAPVADPAGKPTIVNIPNPIVSVAGGTQITISGTGLAGVTSVTVGGLPAVVVSKTDTTVVVQVPVSPKTGLADLTITNDKGSVTSKSAIVYTTNPVLTVAKTKTLTGFAATQKTLTTAQKALVKALISANPKLTKLSCAANTTGVAMNKTELSRAKTWATATCAYAQTLNKSLVTAITATQTLPKAKASRTVALTLKN